jgi:molecular chaperone DnaK
MYDVDFGREKMKENEHRAKTIIYQAERLLREASLDFGINFSSAHRFRIEPLIQRIRQTFVNQDEALMENIEVDLAALQDALINLERDFDNEHQKDEEGEMLFCRKVNEFFKYES